MKSLASTLSTVFFFTVADLIAIPMQKYDWAWLYPTYNRLMGWDAAIDRWSGAGKWTRVSSSEANA